MALTSTSEIKGSRNYAINVLGRLLRALYKIASGDWPDEPNKFTRFTVRWCCHEMGAEKPGGAQLPALSESCLCRRCSVDASWQNLPRAQSEQFAYRLLAL